MGGAPLRTHGLAPTLMAVGASLTTQVVPPSYCAGMFIKYASGGSLSIVGATGTTVGAGVVLDTTYLAIDGPATFFLAAGGATAVAAVIFKQSSGFSLFP